MSRDKKITRHTIESPDPLPFHYLGVVSAEPDYRLSVMINRQLGTDLRKCQDDITVSTDTGTRYFSRFSPTDQAFTLVSNRSEGRLLLRRLKNIDYLVVPCKQHGQKETAELVALLRTIPEITAVFIFDSRLTADRNLALLAP
ncbi:MAG TPA: IPExxxVDY family protein [Bacteroidales bacterium]|nr:IPExxxVDY family protein [Bacteroidales bacterium]